MSAEEREAFRRMAREEGLSLSAWLRKAGLERLAAVGARRRFDDTDSLDEFFRECNAREPGREPDWDEHLGVMRRSRGAGRPDT